MTKQHHIFANGAQEKWHFEYIEYIVYVCVQTLNMHGEDLLLNTLDSKRNVYSRFCF